MKSAKDREDVHGDSRMEPELCDGCPSLLRIGFGDVMCSQAGAWPQKWLRAGTTTCRRAAAYTALRGLRGL